MEHLKERLLKIDGIEFLDDEEIDKIINEIRKMMSGNT